MGLDMVCKTIIGGSIPPRASNLSFSSSQCPVPPVALMERAKTVSPDIAAQNRSKIRTSPANFCSHGIFAQAPIGMLANARKDLMV